MPQVKLIERPRLVFLTRGCGLLIHHIPHVQQFSERMLEWHQRVGDAFAFARGREMESRLEGTRVEFGFDLR